MSGRYPDDAEVRTDKPIRVKATPPADERLEAIRARHAALFPSEWNVCQVVSVDGMDSLGLRDPDEFDATDAAFVRHSRDDVAFLLAEVDRLQEELDNSWQAPDYSRW